MSQDLNSIKARIGSISPAALAKLPKAVQTLIQEDLPRLVNEGYEMREWLKNAAIQAEFDGLPGLVIAIRNMLHRFGYAAPPTPEQQIKEIPW